MSAPVSQPRIIGRYALYDEIAAGGMASVHLGRLLGPVGFSRTVAIKRLHPQFAKDAEFVAMFLDEARLAARIRHPNVVQTLDIVAASTEIFLVMDYVLGEPLSRLRKVATESGAGIPPRIVTSIVCGALHGLHAAHEATSDRGESLEIVHRDVSPHNIVVGIDGVARVLDFGVAKAIGRAHATRDGVVKGKLAYMAPEQLQGKVTRRSDVFAASIVLWEALTGERLFTGDEAELIGQVLTTTPPPPSTHLRERHALLSDEEMKRLDVVTCRGLERRPADRYQTAREMALALEQCIGIASPAEVGAWVEQIAGGRLSERARMVQEIESRSSEVKPASSHPPPEPNAPRAASDEARRAGVSLLTIAAPTSRRARRGGFALWAGVAVIGLGLAAMLQARLGTTAPVAAPAGASASAPTSLSEATALGASSDAPTTATVSPPSALTPTSAASLASVSAARRTPPSLGARKPPVRTTPACNPPYTVDEAGRQHFKEECFH